MAELPFACRYAKAPTNSISGVTHARIAPGTTTKEDSGPAGTPGTADKLVTDRSVSVELYGNDFFALLALIEAAAANVVIGSQDAGGSNRKCTVKSVKFVDFIPPMEIPAKDSGGKVAGCGVRGLAQWGANDTFATMIAWAAE